MQAGLGVNQVVVVFPIVILQSVLQEAEGPVVPGIAPDVEIGDCIPPQITPIDDGPDNGTGALHRRFQVGEPLAPGADFVVLVGALLPRSPDSADGTLPVLRHVEDEGSGRCSGTVVEFLLVPVLVHNRFIKGTEHPIEVAHSDTLNGSIFPFAGKMGGNLGEEPFDGNDGSMSGVVQRSCHRQAPGGEGS